MELPPLTRNYFSAHPNIERACRWLFALFIATIVIILYFYWDPLRETEFTYSLVSLTVSHNLVFYFFQGVTVLGSEGFFLVLLSVVYWSIHKTLGFWGLVVMPLSIFLTSEVPKDIIKLPRPDVRGVTVPTYTFPSGHTSGAVSVWGYLSVMIKTRWIWVCSLTIIMLVGASRVLLGYHFPGDVLGGIVTGSIFLVLFFTVGYRLAARYQKKHFSFALLLFLAVAIPLGLSLLPATFAPNLMGYLAGAAVGYLLERKTLNFDIRGSWQQHLIRALVGLLVILIIIPGLNLLIPPYMHLLTFLQYAFSTFWTTYLAPLTFIKTGFARNFSTPE